MALITPSDNITVKQIRRYLKAHASSFTVRVVNGRMFTYHLAPQRPSNSYSQLQCRALLAEANVLARRDIKELHRSTYWTRQAAIRGYKTAMGCARAHYVAILKKRYDKSLHKKYKYVFANKLSQKYYADTTKKCKFASVNLNLFKHSINAPEYALPTCLHDSHFVRSRSHLPFVWTAVHRASRHIRLRQDRGRPFCT